MNHFRLTGKANLDVLYEAEISRYDPKVILALGATHQRAIEAWSKYPSVGYEINGVEAGGALFDGKEMHLAVLPQFHGRWAWLLKPTLDWLFTLCDPVQIRIEKFNVRCLRFMDAGGWERIEEDEQWITYLVSSKTNHIFNRRATRTQRLAQSNKENVFPALALTPES